MFGGYRTMLSEGFNLEQKREGNKSWKWNIPAKIGANKTKNKGRSMREKGNLKIGRKERGSQWDYLLQSHVPTLKYRIWKVNREA